MLSQHRDAMTTLLWTIEELKCSVQQLGSRVTGMQNCMDTMEQGIASQNSDRTWQIRCQALDERVASLEARLKEYDDHYFPPESTEHFAIGGDASSGGGGGSDQGWDDLPGGRLVRRAGRGCRAARGPCPSGPVVCSDR